MFNYTKTSDIYTIQKLDKTYTISEKGHPLCVAILKIQSNEIIAIGDTLGNVFIFKKTGSLGGGGGASGGGSGGGSSGASSGGGSSGGVGNIKYAYKIPPDVSNNTTTQINALAELKEGHLAIANIEGVRIYNLKGVNKDGVIKSKKLLKHPGLVVLCIAVLKNGNILASGCRDVGSAISAGNPTHIAHKVHLWDVSDLNKNIYTKPMALLEGHTAPIYSLAFLNDT